MTVRSRKNNHIVSAANILPLTKSTEVDPELGTRTELQLAYQKRVMHLY